MTPVPVARRYQLRRLGPGNYLLPSNDGKTLWRIRHYPEEDGRRYWAVLRYKREWSGGEFPQDALPDDDGYLDRAIPPQWKNCTAVNKRYPHGVGRANAHDQVRGSTEPVTTFLHNTALYNTAMKFNKGLDRDKDGIAWEKA